MKCRPKASIPGADLSISLAGRATIDAMSTDAPCIWPVTAVSLLESLGDGLCALDRQGHITYLNPAAASMLGLEPSQVLGKSMHLLAHTRRPDGTVYPPEECAICAAVRSGAACHIDHEVFWRPDGTSFPAEYS